MASVSNSPLVINCPSLASLSLRHHCKVAVPQELYMLLLPIQNRAPFRRLSFEDVRICPTWRIHALRSTYLSVTSTIGRWNPTPYSSTTVLKSLRRLRGEVLRSRAVDSIPLIHTLNILLYGVQNTSSSLPYQEVEMRYPCAQSARFESSSLSSCLVQQYRPVLV
jgi:hypothetical protein